MVAHPRPPSTTGFVPSSHCSSVVTSPSLRSGSLQRQTSRTRPRDTHVFGSGVRASASPRRGDECGDVNNKPACDRGRPRELSWGRVGLQSRSPIRSVSRTTLPSSDEDPAAESPDEAIHRPMLQEAVVAKTTKLLGMTILLTERRRRRRRIVVLSFPVLLHQNDLVPVSASVVLLICSCFSSTQLCVYFSSI